MAEAKNSFIKSKMNKDLDERLIPNNEYRDALNMSVSRSESSDVGALEAILGNITTDTTPIKGHKIIGTFADEANSLIYYFRTNWNQVARANSSAICTIGVLNTLTNSDLTIVNGYFLNFSQSDLMNGISLIENQLFFTDNRNQPRKINVSIATSNNSYYFNEDQISVAKFAPYSPPSFLNLRADAARLVAANDYVESLLPSTMSDAQDPPIVEVGVYKFSQKNLDVKVYRNGDLIPEVISLVDWDLANQNETGAWCYYSNYNGNGVTYGVLYNKWAVLDPRGLAPVGYYIPSLTEWQSIITSAGGSALADSWKSPLLWEPTGAEGNDILGTNVLPAGRRRNVSTGGADAFGFIDLTAKTRFWTSDPIFPAGDPNAGKASYIEFNDTSNILEGVEFPSNGFSVRVVREQNYTGWNGDPDYLSERFVKFSYRFKFDDNEYSIIAPFSQDVFIPFQEGQFVNDDENKAFTSTVVEFMQNSINNAVLNIELPCIDIINKYKVKAIDIIFKQSDMQAYQVIETVRVDSNFIAALNYTNIFQYSYESTIPIKTLDSTQSTRVFDKVPVLARAQETAGNRIMYGNYLEGYSAPAGLDYYVGVDSKSLQQFIEYPQHSVKQNRNYQVGIILSDKYGRQTDVVLSNQDGTLDPLGNPQPGSNFYLDYKNVGFANELPLWTGDTLALYYLQQIPEGDIGISGYPGAYAVGNYYEVDGDSVAPGALYPYFNSLGTICIEATANQSVFNTQILYTDAIAAANTLNVLIDTGNGWILQEPSTYSVTQITAGTSTVITFLPTTTAQTTGNPTGVVQSQTVFLTQVSGNIQVGSTVTIPSQGSVTVTSVDINQASSSGQISISSPRSIPDGTEINFSPGLTVGSVVKVELLYTTNNYYKYTTGAASSTLRPLFPDWPTTYAQYYAVGKKLKGLYIDYTEIESLTPISDSNGVRAVEFFTQEEVNTNYLFDNTPGSAPEPTKSDKNSYATYDINVNGFYTYKSAVKQQQQDYYNVYLPGIVNGYPINDEVKEQNEVATVTLIGDNINKIPRNLENVGPIQNSFTSDVMMWPRVTNIDGIQSTVSPIDYQTFNTQVDPESSADDVVIVGGLDDLFPDLTRNLTNGNPQPGTQNPTGFVNIYSVYNFDNKPFVAQVATQKGVGLGEASYTVPAITDGNFPYPPPMGLAVYETAPFLSPIEIFYESSTSTLISELNLDIQNTDVNITGISDFNINFEEIMSSNTIITSDFYPLASGQILQTTTLAGWVAYAYDSNNQLDTTVLVGDNTGGGQNRFAITQGTNLGSYVIQTTDRFYAGSQLEQSVYVATRGKFLFTLTFQQEDGVQVDQSLTIQLENSIPQVINPVFNTTAVTTNSLSIVPLDSSNTTLSPKGTNGSARKLSLGDSSPTGNIFLSSTQQSGWQIAKIQKISQATGNVTIIPGDATTNPTGLTISDMLAVNQNGTTGDWPVFQDGQAGSFQGDFVSFQLASAPNASGGSPGPMNTANQDYTIWMSLKDSLQSYNTGVDGSFAAKITYSVGVTTFFGQVLISAYDNVSNPPNNPLFYTATGSNPPNYINPGPGLFNADGSQDAYYQIQNWTDQIVYIYVYAAITGGTIANQQSKISSNTTLARFGDNTTQGTDSAGNGYFVSAGWSQAVSQLTNSSNGYSAGPYQWRYVGQLSPFTAAAGGMTQANFDLAISSGLTPGQSHTPASGSEFPAYDFSGCALVNLGLTLIPPAATGSSGKGVYNLAWNNTPPASMPDAQNPPAPPGTVYPISQSPTINEFEPPMYVGSDGSRGKFPTVDMGSSTGQFDGPAN